MEPSPSNRALSPCAWPDGTERLQLDKPEDGRRRVQRRASGGTAASCMRLLVPLANSLEDRVARDWAGKAVRTAADPAQADLDGWGTVCGARAVGVPGCGRPNIGLPALGASRGITACRKKSWASRPLKGRSPSKKTFWGGGGSHRRSRATEQWL